MGGRGRGRGRGSALSFTAEVLGLGRGGDSLPTAVLQPPPLFPPLEYKALPLLAGEAREYMLALKQEFRASSKDSPFFIKPQNKKKDIDRYSDKYQASGLNSDNTQWSPDWSRLPKELQVGVRKKKRSIRPAVKKTIQDKEKTKEIENKLKELEKREEEGSGKEDEEEKEEKEGEAVEDDEEFYDEEEMEEGTDYIVSYFDNGEEFGLDDDDNLEDGPVY
ncbi:DNA-directed RNA polymerase III subunit RPC7-like [Anneissia japonica]|uniref:DNA-directed RNA polymerase III subunit RPC7-like n=1 Tax=Anneissia japonica TaxID=1529436 RepID=UPI001425814B|nr:DNA-directed RNA polymerase III subunit RPC7-like [Anneissia japonica]XP_033111778.1 DNA-directed RNA polymerase III subunit RPC7-like [Anneissia japonica]